MVIELFFKVVRLRLLALAVLLILVYGFFWLAAAFSQPPNDWENDSAIVSAIDYFNGEATLPSVGYPGQVNPPIQVACGKRELTTGIQYAEICFSSLNLCEQALTLPNPASSQDGELRYLETTENNHVCGSCPNVRFKFFQCQKSVTRYAPPGDGLSSFGALSPQVREPQWTTAARRCYLQPPVYAGHYVPCFSVSAPVTVAVDCDYVSECIDPVLIPYNQNPR